MNRVLMQKVHQKSEPEPVKLLHIMVETVQDIVRAKPERAAICIRQWLYEEET